MANVSSSPVDVTTGTEPGFHDAADLFPLMSGEELDALAADILANGLLEPITLLNGRILDGRNRYLACLKAGVQPRFVEFDGDKNPYTFVWSENATRRHLEPGQKAMLFVKQQRKAADYDEDRRRRIEAANAKRAEAMAGRPYAPKGEQRECAGPRDPGHSDASPTRKPEPDYNRERKAVAKAAGVSETTAKRALALVNDPGSADLVAKVATGELTLAQATRERKRAEVKERLESVDAVQAKEATGVYDVIVVDPPWPIQKVERDVAPDQVKELDYPVMTLGQISELTIPGADDCHLWLWTTQRFLPDAFDILADWGFQYSCTFVWHKPGGFQVVGLPQFNCEFALYARRGKPQFIDTKAFNTCFEAPRGKHSEKPEAFYEMVRRVTAGRRLDMFNRRAIDGFCGWGKEALHE